MKLLDGKKIAADIQQGIKRQVDLLTKRKPTLAFILIGDDPASKSYVKMKNKRCMEVGIESRIISLPDTVSIETLYKEIIHLNKSPEVDGILVQQPFPKQIAKATIVEAIDPKKDVDGFHPLNLGKLLMGEEDGFIPCTPLGIVKLLEANQIDLDGKHVVIVGRSNIVGKPLAAILVQKKKCANATATLAHSHTQKLKELCLQADVLVAALGRPAFITEDMVRPGATVIDVGMNRIIDVEGNTKLVGDVDFDRVKPLCSAITPVPGGVGPMTIAMLLSNTLKSYHMLCATSTFSSSSS